MGDVEHWKRRFREWRGQGPIETDLTAYRSVLAQVEALGIDLRSRTETELRESAAHWKAEAQSGASAEDLLVPVFALVREIADRALGLRPFDVQVMAGAALHGGKLVEMQTGEGKTLAAVLPACLAALAGRGVHVLTFNDYLARRDAAWMGPIYAWMGLTVGVVQAGQPAGERGTAYAADVTYATAKEAGFDFLRAQLVRSTERLVQRPFHFALVDEADSILIDEARVPLVIAGDRLVSDTSPYRLAEIVSALEAGLHFETDGQARNVQLTERGIDRIEARLRCGDLHGEENFLLLTEINQALHARALLRRDVDYIVRDGRIELVDEFTGRVVPDRRWPDGLQAALEAREGLPIQPGGRVLGSVTLQHFLAHYPKLAGMTATARPAAWEFEGFYGLKVVPLPPHRPCIRRDEPDVVFTHREAKMGALVEEIARMQRSARPVLVGTASVKESEDLADRLALAGIRCRVLNARNDEAEAAIVAEAGAPGAVTISTNMAGRGTDIRLGGTDESQRDAVVAVGGLYVIGTNRNESRRIDDQLRGRAGRQGDPGSSRFFVSLEDDLVRRYGFDELVPPRWRPPQQNEPLDLPLIRRELDRVQRIVEGQHFEIRKTLWRYSSLLERQRALWQDWRTDVLLDRVAPEVCAERCPERYAALVARFGEEEVRAVERALTLHVADACWSDHLDLVSHLREGIHLVGIGGLDPLREFHNQMAQAFVDMNREMEDRIASQFDRLEVSEDGIRMDHTVRQGPSATWTYLVNDQVQSDIQQLLFGPGNIGFAAGAVILWPLLGLWGLWRRWKTRAGADE